MSTVKTTVVRETTWTDADGAPCIKRSILEIPEQSVVIDRARFERLRAVARAVWTKQVGGPEWTGTYKDDIAISRALNQMLDSDLDPLP